LHTQLLVSSDLKNIKLNQLQLDTLLTGDLLPNGELNSQLKTDINVALDKQNISINGLDIKTTITADNLPNKKVTTQLNADVSYQLDKQLATIKSLKLLVDQIELAGKLSVQTGSITKVRYDLVTNELDLNRYMPPSSEKKESVETSPTSNKEVEPDLSLLNNLDIDGQLKIAAVNIDKIKVGEINNRLIIKNGKAQIKPLTAQLYQGLLTVNGEVDESKGRNIYTISTKLKNVQIHQLLIDAAEIDLLSGTTNFDFTAKGQGLTATKIKQGLVGKGNFKLLDGELYGVNIPQEIRILKAKLTAKKTPTSDSVKKTDFASLTGKFSINKGLVDNQKLLMLSPVMRLDGLGLVDILKETLDYKLSISPLSSSKADTDHLDLSGLTIPMLIKGSFTDPKISLDTDSALKEQLKAKSKALEKKAKAKLKAEQKRLQKKADKELKKHQDKLDADTQKKIKKESKRLEDKLKKFF
ncbi:MAG: AsmA family protein, partial [Psychromonas sp.]|nr:AsmA family protein [Psychromonas sp.]